MAYPSSTGKINEFQWPEFVPKIDENIKNHAFSVHHIPKWEDIPCAQNTSLSPLLITVHCGFYILVGFLKEGVLSSDKVIVKMTANEIHNQPHCLFIAHLRDYLTFVMLGSSFGFR